MNGYQMPPPGINPGMPPQGGHPGMQQGGRPTDDEFQRMIAQLDPKTLAELGVMPQQQQLSSDAQARADALRNTPGPEGRTVRNGIYVASSPTAALAAGGQRMLGGIQSGMATRRQNDMAQRRAAILRELLAKRQSMALGQGGMQGPGGPGGTGIPGGMGQGPQGVPSGQALPYSQNT